jgi:hypothetical protein
VRITSSELRQRRRIPVRALLLGGGDGRSTRWPVWLRGVLQSRTRVGMRGFRDSVTLTAKRAEQSLRGHGRVSSVTRGLRRVLTPAWPGGRNSGPLLHAVARSSPLCQTLRPARMATRCPAPARGNPREPLTRIAAGPLAAAAPYLTESQYARAPCLKRSASKVAMAGWTNGKRRAQINIAYQEVDRPRQVSFIQPLMKNNEGTNRHGASGMAGIELMPS